MKNKFADCEPFNNTRELIKFLNNNNISKEDIVEILNIKEQLLLIYYRTLDN